VIATCVGGLLTTVTGAEPFALSTVPMMLADPVETPLTTPVEALTLTTDVLLELHVTVFPVSTPPLVSYTFAVACVVAPLAMLDDASDTATVPTDATVMGATTETLAVP
jgi:hypothetical protein